MKRVVAVLAGLLVLSTVAGAAPTSAVSGGVRVRPGDDWTLPGWVRPSANSGLFSETAAPEFGVGTRSPDLSWRQLQPDGPGTLDTRTAGLAQDMGFPPLSRQLADRRPFWVRIFASGSRWAPAWVADECGVEPLGPDYDGLYHLPLWNECVWGRLLALYRRVFVDEGLRADPRLRLVYVPGAFTWAEYDYDMVGKAAEQGLTFETLAGGAAHGRRGVEDRDVPAPPARVREPPQRRHRLPDRDGPRRRPGRALRPGGTGAAPRTFMMFSALYSSVSSSSEHKVSEQIELREGLMAGNRIMTEIAAQPECWRRAAGLADGLRDALPARGERVAVVGCGTSLFMAQAYAALREDAGHGETDAFAASEMPRGRRYDRVLALTRSGTTTEVLAVLDRLGGSVPTTAITADPDTPVSRSAGRLIVLDFADEESVVQTRFATTQLALLRAHLGEDLTAAIAAAEDAVADPVPPELLDVEQITFLGRGWTVGLAQEAALKMREAACFWTEAYPAMEYRHGPISITGPGRAVWMFGGLPDGLGEQVAATGGLLRAAGADPLAELVRVQRLAVARASAAGLDPERPRHLTRSVILDAAPGGPAA